MTGLIELMRAVAALVWLNVYLLTLAWGQVDRSELIRAKGVAWNYGGGLLTVCLSSNSLKFNEHQQVEGHNFYKTKSFGFLSGLVLV